MGVKAHPTNFMENLSDSFEAFTINDRLIENYGRRIGTNKAKFRVVHSDDQIEKRFGEFDIYADADEEIWLRKEMGIREVPKYGWLDNQWVVEKLLPNDRPEVFEGDFIYEPLLAFPSGLPLNWDAVEIVVKKILEVLPIETVGLPKTLEEAEYQKKLSDAKEKARILNMLDNTTTMSALHDKSAVVVPEVKGEDNVVH